MNKHIAQHLHDTLKDYFIDLAAPEPASFLFRGKEEPMPSYTKVWNAGRAVWVDYYQDHITIVQLGGSESDDIILPMADPEIMTKLLEIIKSCLYCTKK